MIGYLLSNYDSSEETAYPREDDLRSDSEKRQAGRRRRENVNTKINQVEAGNLSLSSILSHPSGNIGFGYWIRSLEIPSRVGSILEGRDAFTNRHPEMMPYLSIVIDGPKDSATTSKERSHDVLFQLIIEGVVRLFNRYALWEDTTAKQHSNESSAPENKPAQENMLTADDTDDDDASTLVDEMRPDGIRLQSWDELQHFGVTTCEDEFGLWVFKPNLYESRWIGCSVELIQHGSLDDEWDVHCLVESVTLIHRWAETLYTEAIKENLRDL